MADRTRGSGFAVPVAFTEAGRLVRPDQAERGHTFRCPGCSQEVALRRGDLKRPHFAHGAGVGCTPESALHRAAKHTVVRVIAEWQDSSGPRPCVSRSCLDYKCQGGIVQDVPDDVTHAEEEVRLGNGSVADVVLFRGHEPAVAVEILVTHRVGPEKATGLQLPWMELEAEAVLDRPYWWVAVQDGLHPFDCPTCASRRAAGAGRLEEIRRQAVAVATTLGIRLPSNPPYAYVAHTCWRCGADMVLYLWPGGGRHSLRRPPPPVPATLELRVTEGWGGEYWANCCPHCSAVQGDHTLSTSHRDYMVVRESLLD